MKRDVHAVLARIRAAIVARGWSATARACGHRRETLHRAFPERPRAYMPNLRVLADVTHALGLKLTIEDPESLVAGPSNQPGPAVG